MGAVIELALTRGDSRSFLVSAVNKNGEPRPFRTGDTVYCTVKKSERSEKPLIQKIMTVFDDDGKAALIFNPSDFANMKHGYYKYDVSLVTSDGAVCTIVNPSAFYVTADIT